MKNVYTTASLVLTGFTGTANASGFVAAGGAIPASFGIFVWLPFLALTLGCVVALAVMIARQPQEEVRKPPVAKTMDSASAKRTESPYEMQRAA